MANAAVEKIIIQGESRGLDELAHDLDDVAAAQGRVSQATRDVATVTDRSSKTVSQSSRAYERVAAQVDAAYRAERQYTQGKAALDKAFQQQIIDATVYAQRIDQLSAKYQRLDAANDNAVASLSRVERATQGVHRGMGTAATAIGGTVAALGGLAALQQSVGSFISMSDQASKLEGRLKLVTTSSDQLASVQRDLFQVSQDTRSSFGSNVELYARAAQATAGLGIGQKELITLTTVLNQGFALSGATAEEASNAIIQLSQGLASGALRGEEFNSINEGGARITKALADSLGLTVSQLRAVAAEGKLTNDVVVKGLLSQAPVLAAEFGKVPRTVGDATTQIGNSMLRAVASVNKAADATSSLVGQLDRVRALIDDPAFAGIMSGIAASIVADIRTVNDIFREVEAVRAWAAEIQASAKTVREAIAASASSLYTTWKTATDQNMALIGPWIEAWTLGALSVQDANSAAASNAGLSWSGFVDASVNEIATLIAAAKALGSIGSELGIAGTFQAELASAREMLNGYRDTLTGAGAVVLDTVTVPAQEATGAMLAMKYGVQEVTAATVAAVPQTIKLGESTDALEKAAKKATESFANQDRAIDSQVAGLQRQIDAFDASEGASAALPFRAVSLVDAVAQASQEAAE